MSRLHSGYRGTQYLKIPQRSEPRYTAATNSVNLHSRNIASRRKGLLDFLLKHADPLTQHCIVDIGGDARQFHTSGTCQV